LPFILPRVVGVRLRVELWRAHELETSMIYNIPHVTKFIWPAPLKLQWNVVHLPPARKDGNGGSVYLDLDWLEYIRAMNTPEAFKWMIGDAGTIIWGIKDKKNLGSRLNKARMPVIAIGGNPIYVVDGSIKKGYGRVDGMGGTPNYNVTPENFPALWHRIWCLTKVRKGVSAPHDTPRGPAFMPILDVSAFRRTKALAAGETFIRVVGG
jgi:hypothetical protein